MMLSRNFSLAEMTKSQTAERHGIDNTPGQEEIHNLILLCDNVLQPMRDAIEKPIRINSGFRCLELNRKLGSKDTSQHVKGQAVDIEVMGFSNFDLAEYISETFPFDQLILEFWYDNDDPNSGWVHLSYNELGNREQVLTINKHGVFPGLGY